MARPPSRTGRLIAAAAGAAVAVGAGVWVWLASREPQPLSPDDVSEAALYCAFARDHGAPIAADPAADLGRLAMRRGPDGTEVTCPGYAGPLADPVTIEVVCLDLERAACFRRVETS